MSLPTLAQFEADARARGYDEVIERSWQPGTVLDSHAHDFDVDAIVVQGEMWLTVGDETRHMRAGDRFGLARGIPHSERYGDEGATYWVARRNG
jgi:mannose-6-phosphate isomerase-like protein (cupin superfamily)